MTLALDGIRVIDLCRSYPPAYASMFLADFGADVIKVDPPGFTSPIPVPGGPEAQAAWYSLDRNKKSLLLNMRDPEGLDIFYRLVESADVLLENSKPGTMERLKIGYDILAGINPRLIYCSVSGYGQDGPYALIPGHDSNYLSISGVLSMIGEKGGPPIAPGNLVADLAGSGMFSLSAILLALLARGKTGKGQFIDVSYTDTAFSLAGFETALYFLTGMEPRRGETLRTGSEPFCATYETKDGKWFNIACIEPKLWINLCRALDREDLISHQWTFDQEIKSKVFTELREIFKTKTRDEWWDWAKDKEIAAAPVLELNEAFEDPQIQHRKMLLELDHPALGKIKQAGFPIKMSETPASFSRFGPTPGQDSDAILIDLGFSSDQINKLREQGIV